MPQTAAQAHPYRLVLSGDYGRIWNKRPSCTRRGLLSIIQNPKLHNSTFGNCFFKCCALSPKGDVLATVDNRGNGFAFHMKRNRFAILARAGVAGTTMTFSRRHKRDLFVAFADHSVRVYDIDSGRMLATLKGHHSSVVSISISATEDQLVTCSQDSVLLWDLKRFERKTTLGTGAYGASYATFSNVNSRIVTAFNDDSIWIWDSTALTLQKKLRAPTTTAASHMCQTLALSNDDHLLVAGGNSPVLLVWDLVADVLMYGVRLPHPVTNVFQIYFLPDNRTLAVGGSDGALYFVDVLSLRLVHYIPNASKWRMCDAFSIDGRANYATLVSEDGHISVYDLNVLRSNSSASTALARVEVSSIQDAVLRAGLPQSNLPEADTKPRAMGHAMEVDENCEPLDGYPDFILDVRSHQRPGLLDAHPGTRKQVLSWSSEAQAGNTPQTGTPSRKVRDGGREDVRAAWTEARATTRGRLGLQFHELDTTDTRLNLQRLRALLDAYGEYPEKHRNTVWKFLLRLPGNVDAHGALLSRGPHPAFNDFATKFPIKNRQLQTRLVQVLSCLAHWCPLFAEVPFVPAMVFPFVKLFGPDKIGAFEAVATLVTNWLSDWFELFPEPPLDVLRRVASLVRFVDPELHFFLEDRGGGTGHCAWALLQTLFTEVTSKSEWLKLWDHVLSNNPSFIYFVAAHYLVCFRDLLLAAAGPEEVAMILASSNPLDINRFIRQVYSMRQAVPADILPQDPELAALPKTDVYPLFRGYPKVAVDAAALERERIRKDEELLLQRKATIADLQKRTQELEAQEAAWVTERGRLQTIEEQHRLKMKADEANFLRERIQLDDAEKAERLKQIAAVEGAYRANLAKQQAAWRSELDTLRAEVDHKRKLYNYSLRSRSEEENIKKLEFKAQQRLWNMEEDQTQKQRQERLKEEVATKQKASELQLQRQEEVWKTEDEERSLRLKAESERRKRASELNEELWARQQADAMLLREELEREVKVTEVERERRLRTLAEDEAAASTAALDAARARAAVTQKEEAQLLKQAADSSQRWYMDQNGLRKEMLQSEQAMAARETEARAMRIAEVERGQQRRALEAMLADQRRHYEAMNQEEESAARAVLEQLELERRKDRELEMELQLKNKELEERLAHNEKANARQEAVVFEERAKFNQMREEMANRAAEQEGEARRHHEEVMARMALERERQLLDLEKVWRKQVQHDELAALTREASSREVYRQEVDDRFTDRERAIATEVEDLRYDGSIPASVKMPDISHITDKMDDTHLTGAAGGAPPPPAPTMHRGGPAATADRLVASANVAAAEAAMTHTAASTPLSMPSSGTGTGSSPSAPGTTSTTSYTATASIIAASAAPTPYLPSGAGSSHPSQHTSSGSGSSGPPASALGSSASTALSTGEKSSMGPAGRPPRSGPSSKRGSDSGSDSDKSFDKGSDKPSSVSLTPSTTGGAYGVTPAPASTYQMGSVSGLSAPSDHGPSPSSGSGLSSMPPTVGPGPASSGPSASLSSLTTSQPGAGPSAASSSFNTSAPSGHVSMGQSEVPTPSHVSSDITGISQGSSPGLERSPNIWDSGIDISLTTPGNPLRRAGSGDEISLSPPSGGGSSDKSH